ncbi:MAG: hypothetical protein CMG85_19525 [Marinobacter sp.]|nr:hypothetical protein [Marinobacter sp.]
MKDKEGIKSDTLMIKILEGKIKELLGLKKQKEIRDLNSFTKLIHQYGFPKLQEAGLLYHRRKMNEGYWRLLHN